MATLAVYPAISASYREDIVAWAAEQVALMRAGRFVEADLENIIEELEGVARGECLAAASQMARAIEHLLKLEFSPATSPRAGWLETVFDARSWIDRNLEASPSLRRELETWIEAETRRGSRAALNSLQAHGELTRALEAAIVARRYSVDEVCTDWIPPRR